MSKQLMIKPEKCVSCRTCELVCSFGHHEEFNPTLSAVSVFNYEDNFISVPIMCMQCDEACCMEVCPVEAISRDEDGVVKMDPDKCIVCKLCMNACPLGNISYSPITKKVFKCDYCDGDPECVKYCKGGALEFVEVSDSPDRKGTIAEKMKEIFGEAKTDEEV